MSLYDKKCQQPSFTFLWPYREKMKVSANCIFSIILTHLQIIVYRHNFGLWSDLGDKGDTMSNNQWEIESKVQ